MVCDGTESVGARGAVVSEFLFWFATYLVLFLLGSAFGALAL